jgi:hypothetical protein
VHSAGWVQPLPLVGLVAEAAAAGVVLVAPAGLTAHSLPAAACWHLHHRVGCCRQAQQRPRRGGWERCLAARADPKEAPAAGWAELPGTGTLWRLLLPCRCPAAAAKPHRTSRLEGGYWWPHCYARLA